MRARRRLRSLVRISSYQRAWHSVERWAVADALLRRPEIKRIEAIRDRYFPGSSKIPDEAPWKYLDVARALDLNIGRAQHLGLLGQVIPERSRKILDLGCGPGLFLFVCKTRGHDCLGLDVGDVPLYDELMEVLDIPRVEARIEAFGHLPDFPHAFDAITALGTVFNRNENGWWREAEWTHFLDDVDRHLAPGGRLFIEPNPMRTARSDRSAQTPRYTPEALCVFRARGAAIDRRGILFPPRISPDESKGRESPSRPLHVRSPQITGRDDVAFQRTANEGADPTVTRSKPRRNEPGQGGSAPGKGLDLARAASSPRWRKRSILGTSQGLPKGGPRIRGIRRRHGLRRGLAMMAALLVFVSSAELGVRAFDPQELRLRWYSRKGVMVFVPGFRGSQGRSAPGSPIETNSDGLRDREYPRDKTQGTFRILVLGDALTAGLQVPFESTYPKRLESLLAALHPSSRAEVVNAGIPGYGTADELRYLEAFGERWKPDLVLVAFFAGNDVANNVTEGGLYYERDRIHVRRRALSEWQYRMKSLRSWIGSHSHLYQLLRGPSPPTASASARGRRALGDSADGNAAISGRGGPVRDSSGWKEDAGPTGWQLTFDLLGRIDEVTRSLGARLALVAIPEPGEPASARTVGDRGFGDRPQDGQDLRPGQRVCAFAESVGASCIDLSTELGDSGEARAKTWEGDRYFSSQGHERAARTLATFLLKQKLIPEAGA